MAKQVEAIFCLQLRNIRNVKCEPIVGKETIETNRYFLMHTENVYLDGSADIQKSYCT